MTLEMENNALQETSPRVLPPFSPEHDEHHRLADWVLGGSKPAGTRERESLFRVLKSGVARRVGKSDSKSLGPDGRIEGAGSGDSVHALVEDMMTEDAMV